MRDYQLVSGDSHIETPPDLWTARMPAHLKERAPRVVEMPEGGGGLDLGMGAAPQGVSLAMQAGVAYKDLKRTGFAWDGTAPGTGDGASRVAEQDKDGMDAELLFCSVAAQLAKESDDTELVIASMRSYNDWVLEDYNSEAPDRLFGLPLLPTTGVADAVAELHRVSEKLEAFRAVQLLRFPTGAGNLSDEDEPLWTAAEDLGITIACHHNFGSSEELAPPRILGEGKADQNMFTYLLTCDLPVPTLPIFTILQLMLGGVLDRHPKLRFIFAETYIGWIPYWIEQMDDRYERHRHWMGVDLPRPPSQYLRDHFAFTFQEDHIGVKLREDIGIDNICWATDTPHPVGDWPYSAEVAARQFRGIPDEERRKIQSLNTLEWIGVLSRAQKNELAKKPVIDRTPAELAARGERRMA